MCKDEFDVIIKTVKRSYNDRFCFRNIECKQHLQRDLQKVADDFRGHEWARKVKGLISSAIKDRKDRISAGEESFSDEYVTSFFRRLDCYLSKGLKESEKDSRPEEQTFEKTLLARIAEYKGNYFLWVKDFKMPTTDNLSERGLRGIKSHMKISGQFDSERTAQYYAAVKYTLKHAAGITTTKCRHYRDYVQETLILSQRYFHNRLEL